MKKKNHSAIHCNSSNHKRFSVPALNMVSKLLILISMPYAKIRGPPLTGECNSGDVYSSDVEFQRYVLYTKPSLIWS